MFGWLKLRPKENWRLVKTFSVSATFTFHNKIRKDEKVYYHLFESDRGRRKIDIESTMNIVVDPYDGNKLQRMAEKLPFYQEKIYRWKQGRRDPDIPTYDQVPEEDTVNILKGKV